MTPKHQTTTLQAARQYIRCRKEVHYLNHGLGTLAAYLTDTDQMDTARLLFREAHDRASVEMNQAIRQYTKAMGHRRHYNVHMHLYRLGEIAEQYAWK